MKKLIILFVVTLNLNALAETVKHSTCEAYINEDGVTKFSEVSGLSMEYITETLKEKNFTDVNFYKGSIRTQFATTSAETLLDVSIVARLDGKAGPLSRFDINEVKNENVTPVKANKLSALTVNKKKTFLMTNKRLAKKLGLEILKQFPTCELK